MKKIKNFLSVIFFVLITSCGYTPLLQTGVKDFYINQIVIEGDRQINNFIVTDLKKHQKTKNENKKYDLKITTTYEKKVINKDKNGDPKNYNLKINLNLNALKNGNIEINKIFEKNTSMSAQSKKISERELEKKYKNDLSKSLIKDVIFFLRAK